MRKAISTILSISNYGFKKMMAKPSNVYIIQLQKKKKKHTIPKVSYRFYV